MVCKENVVSWFGNLSSFKRIDVMCTLLNMCLPFEVRYLGTCVEDIGKRDYTDLRESEERANNPTDLAELANQGIGDKRTRRKLALYMALLKSCNYSCAAIFHKIMANLDGQEIMSITNAANFSQDDQPMEELLLLYTMALNHPAFTYEQKSTFGNIYLKLVEEESRLNLPKSAAAAVTPLAAANSSYKSTQISGGCVTSNERGTTTETSVEMPTNCSMPPPPIPGYHGEMGMRGGNPMVSGVPPGLSLPPPGLCLPPGHEQMTIGGATTSPQGAQYLHLGFPTAVNHITPWAGQMMIGNPMMYHTSEILAYPPSPLVSRQSSPSHSRSPSRSNSPLGNRRTNNGSQLPRTSSQVVQSTSNTLTTTSTNSQSSLTNTCPAATHLPPPPIGRNITAGPPPLLPPRSCPPPPTIAPNTSVAYSRHTQNDNTSSSTVVAGSSSMSTSKQQPPPPRLRAANSNDNQRDKDVNNFKGNLPNTSFGEIRRMSDEDLRDMGMTPNALGQLRNIVRSQTTNGLSQNDKKLETTNNVAHPIVDSPDIEEQQQSQQQQQQTMQQQSLQQQNVHHQQNHGNSGNMRRYPPISPLEQSPMQMYAPPPMYPQNAHCYGCMSMPVAGLPGRYPRCNAQHLFCTSQLQALRLDSEGSRHCSQSSSSESTGSRSPPETPPAVTWVGGSSETNVPAVASSSSSSSSSQTSNSVEHQSSVSTSSSSLLSSHHTTMSHQSSQQQQQGQTMGLMSERPRNHSKKNQSHVMRQKNQMLNGTSGGGNGANSGPVTSGGNGNGGAGGQTNIPHCVSFAAPPTPSQLTFLPHAHFPALRPSTGIYTNFSHPAFARPTYQPNYQPNGEMIYQPYPGHPGPGGTPPPPQPTVAAPPPQSYMATAPVLTYTPIVQQAKISCYNCGSCTHLAADCKDQTMEELTKRATYRLDYATMKQPGDCPSSDK